MAKLVGTVARRHDVTVDEVNAARVTRPVAFDVLVFVSFGVLYAFAVDRGARWAFRSLGWWDDSIRAALTVVFASAGATALAVMLGDIWSGVAEMIRLGNEHLSYRAYRSPWIRHRPAISAAGAIIFMLVALRRYRAFRRSESIDGHV